MPLVDCLKIAVRQLPPPSSFGLTHASSVIPVVRSSELLSGTVTEALVPLKLRALPNLPPASHVVPDVVPLFPVPDASPTALPVPSLKP